MHPIRTLIDKLCKTQFFVLESLINFPAKTATIVISMKYFLRTNKWYKILRHFQPRGVLRMMI